MAFRDLWLTIRWGKWYVHEVRVQVRDRVTYEYYVRCRRTGDNILCYSKWRAENVAAMHNDSRGMGNSNPNGC